MTNKSLKDRLHDLPKSQEGHWGYSHVKIIEHLKKYDIKSMLEIGFNTGYSATLFLHHLPLNEFYSLDIGLHPFVNTLHKEFSILYEGKFFSTIEDSMNIRNTILNEKTYDLIFIDGCHKYEVALNDMLFSIDRAKYILLDDTAGSSPGVTKLIEFINKGSSDSLPLIGDKLRVDAVFDVPAGAILYEVL
jgi:hypothetical protein